MVKIIIVLSCLFWIGATFGSETTLSEFSLENIAKTKKREVGNLYRLKEVIRYGFINESGSWVIPPKFVDVSGFDKAGYARAAINGRINDGIPKKLVDGKYGFIDSTGEWLIEPRYDDAESYWTDEKYVQVKLDNETGYIDRNGNFTLGAIPKRNESKPSAKKPELKLDVKTNKYGVFDNTSEEWLIEPRFELEETNGFFAKMNGLWGEINVDGTWKFKPQFHAPKLSSSSRWGIYFSISFYDDGLAVVANKNGGNGLINKQGEWVLKPEFYGIYEALGSNGLRGAKKTIDSQYGYIDSTGKYHIPPIYDDVERFVSGYAVVEKEGKCGVIDGRGKLLIDTAYESCSHNLGGFFGSMKSLDEKLFLIKMNDKYGLMNLSSNWILEPLFDNIRIQDKKMIHVTYNDYEGYANIKGEPLTFTYDEVKNVTLSD